jgi:glycerate 2-kinase
MKYVDPHFIIKRTSRLKGSTLLLRDIVYNNILELDLNDFNSIYLVGAGKATAGMAEALYSILNGRISAGAINVPYHTDVQIDKILVTEANHPAPDEAGVSGTKKIIDILRKTMESDLVIVLLSGGASALMPLPSDGITVGDKQRIISEMMSAGASIDEINVVRKHLSKIKGGQLLSFVKTGCTVISLILSDVIGDKIETIASGPTTPDSSTFRDAEIILKKYNIWGEKKNSAAKQVIVKGINGIIKETPKPGDPVFGKVHNLLIGNNAVICQKAKMYLKKRGLRTVNLGSSFDGEAGEFGCLLARLAAEIGRPSKPFAYILGGETTVKLNNQTNNNGLGGRNQEAILTAALKSKFHPKEDVTILSMGTDGIDGRSDAAGGFATPKTVSMLREKEKQMKKYLDNHDSYNGLRKLKSLIMTGRTGTNVNDISIICRLS